MTFYKKHQLGFTLLELLMTAVIGMLIAYTAFEFYHVALVDQEVKETADLINFTSNTVNTATATSGNYDIVNAAGTSNPISTADIITALGGDTSDFPIGVTVSGNTIYHPFGDLMNVSVDSSSPGADDILHLDFLNIPKDACAELLEKVAQTSYDMSVNGNLVGLTPPSSAAGPGRGDIRVYQAAPLCSANPTSTITIRILKEINFSQLRVQPFAPVLNPKESLLIMPLYTRQQNALSAKETAQLAIP